MKGLISLSKIEKDLLTNNFLTKIIIIKDFEEELQGKFEREFC